MLKNVVIQWAIEQFEKRKLTKPGDNALQAFQISGFQFPELIDPKAFERPLLSIFSLIKLHSEKSDNQILNKLLLPQKVDSSTIVYPVSDISSYATDDFCIEELKKAKQDDDLALVFLEKYGSFRYIPDKKGERIFPFYDTVKSAAAISDCLMNGDVSNPFLLVFMDLSGIQNFVYTISSKGALKSLRARSFMLEMFTEHIIFEILKEARAKRYNMIFSGGGGFGLILPNIKNLKEKIMDFHDILNNWLFKNAGGKLFIALDIQDYSSDDLCLDFNRIRREITDRIEMSKKQKFANRILTDLFTMTMPVQLNSEDECQICHRDDLPMKDILDLVTGNQVYKMGKEEKWIAVCNNCYHLYHIGDELTSFNSIFRSYRKISKHFFTFPAMNGKDAFYSLSNNENEKTEAVWEKNSWDLSHYTTKTIPLLYADYTLTVNDLPLDAQKIENEEWEKDHKYKMNINETSASFMGMAYAACGANMISALRMDVDNLGQIFFHGLGDDFNIITFSTLSRYLNLFFKLYLNRICSGRDDISLKNKPLSIMKKDYTNNNRKGRYVSVVYSGGDDLFIVGAWDEVCELAYDIYKCFKEFTCNNPDIGISAGLTVHQPKFPLYQMARLSGEAEKEAKSNEDDNPFYSYRKESAALFYNRIMKEKNKQIYKKVKYQRNTCGMLDPTDEGKRISISMKWHEFNDFVINVFNWFEPFMVKDNEKILKFKDRFPLGFPFKLLDLLGEWEEKGNLFLPHLIWLLNKTDIFLRETQNPLEKKGDLIQLFHGKRINHLHIPLTWIEYLKRGGN